MTNETQQLREEIADEVLSVGVPFDLGPTRDERRVSPSLAVMIALFASGAAVAMAADRVMDRTAPRSAAVSPMALESDLDTDADTETETDSETETETVPADHVDEPSDVAGPRPNGQREGSPPTASGTATDPDSDSDSDSTVAITEPRRPRPAAPVTVSEPTPEDSTPANRWDNGGADTPESIEPSIDDLLDRALGGAPSEPVVTPTESLPETPTRRQVLTTLRSLEGEVRQCVEGEDGVVSTRIVVEGATGRVASVHVTGALAGTVAGSCAARVVRTARFPRFARERFEIAFPYSV